MQGIGVIGVGIQASLTGADIGVEDAILRYDEEDVRMQKGLFTQLLRCIR